MNPQHFFSPKTLFLAGATALMLSPLFAQATDKLPCRVPTSLRAARSRTNSC